MYMYDYIYICTYTHIHVIYKLPHVATCHTHAPTNADK